MSLSEESTICAIATAPGRGGVGIIRISGPKVTAIATQILGFEPTTRLAHTSSFLDLDGSIIDTGIAILFKGPNSYTGEDVLELQGHGSAPLLGEILGRVLSLGAQMAQPGEFTERSFLNGKMDLAQAEAVADLIEASTVQQAKSASRTLHGAFSARIKKLQEKLTETRVHIEATIDFADEDLDSASEKTIINLLNQCLEELASIFKEAQQGALIKDGLQIVIAGYPNSGKSTLLNTLAGIESAIVTEIPGTTRDVLNVDISIEGIPINLSDTAGFRETEDLVEQEGVKRAQHAVEAADHILFVVDATTLQKDFNNLEGMLDNFISKFSLKLDFKNKFTIINNKLDKIENSNFCSSVLPVWNTSVPIIGVSAAKRKGIELIRSHLAEVSGYIPSSTGNFSARTRHINALKIANSHLDNAKNQSNIENSSELMAEELRLTQRALGTITGQFSSDDLLGEIFASFCIGK